MFLEYKDLPVPRIFWFLLERFKNYSGLPRL
jgi:hypothetical protein